MKIFNWLLLPGIILLACSCSSVYMPNTPNTPMLSAKGELYSGGHISLKGNASFTSAYAVSDHIGIVLNGAFMNQNKEKKGWSKKGKGAAIGGGAGAVGGAIVGGTKGAIIGGAAGAVGGAVVGKNKDKKKDPERYDQYSDKKKKD